MRSVVPLVDQIRPYFAAEADLLRVALNSTSWVEASLAVEVLEKNIPEKPLVTAANIREAIKELPRSPIAMAVDFETLARVWQLEREGMAWKREFDDDTGGYAIMLLGQGNLCYDIVVRADGETRMWISNHPEEEYLDTEVVDLIMQRETLLKNVIDLVGAMGLPFSPIFYLSLEDWRQEYAETLFGEVVDLFGEVEIAAEPADEAPRPAPFAVPPIDEERRMKYLRDEGSVSWFG